MLRHITNFFNTKGCTTLPAHTIRHSSRAKRVFLRFHRVTGLEVVLPMGMQVGIVPEILMRHSKWIEQKQKALLQLGKLDTPDFNFCIKGRSEQIILCCPAGKPLVNYLQNPSTLLAARQGGRCISIPDKSYIIFHKNIALAQQFSQQDANLAHYESITFSTAGKAWLCAWVKTEAKVWLAQMLEALACEFGFSYSSMRVKFQKTRWGSCSAKGNINLNAALLFLPQEQVRYILLHELCHTKNLNHSESFWRELFRVDKNALKNDKSMRYAKKYIPSWVL